MRNYLEETLGAEWVQRFVSAQPVVVSFRGRRLPEEVARRREVAAYTDKIMREALSDKVIAPGKTTEKDVADYLARRTEEFGARVAFASVVVGPSRGHAGPSERVIQPGDLVRIDFGITHRRYSTDVQRTAYVLGPGESGPPAEIQKMWDTRRRATARARLEGALRLDRVAEARKGPDLRRRAHPLRRVRAHGRRNQHRD